MTEICVDVPGFHFPDRNPAMEINGAAPKPLQKQHNSEVESLQKSKDNYCFMLKQKISAKAAADYGLDPEEADLALRYAAASKELAQRTLTATPDEASRLKGMKRLASLTLDLYQRLKVAMLLPRVLVDERQADLATQLSGTSQNLRNVEKKLFGRFLTPIDALVTKAETGRSAYRRKNPEPELEAKAPTTQRPVDRNHPHLAA